jgi:Zn-dependent protease
VDFQMLPYFAIIVVITFLFHEIAHRYVANKFGCAAVYKVWPSGVFLSLFLMTFGIKFVAPGAVFIYPYQFGRWGHRKKELTVPDEGLIGLSGPATNIIFAILFSFFIGRLMISNVDFFGQLVFVNAWIAFFNLLPSPPLDGSKVLKWRWWVWILAIVMAGILMTIY